MSQRDSGYKRQELDLYETPVWVTDALVPHLTRKNIWEPACGSGKMVRALEAHGFQVVGTDISKEMDFLMGNGPILFEAIVTNPPYSFATEFIDRALQLTFAPKGLVAMLLRTDFDHAKTRQSLFGNCPQFAKKIVLTKRIKWFEDSTGSPSFNHAWYLWDWKHSGPPVIAYGP